MDDSMKQLGEGWNDSRALSCAAGGGMPYQIFKPTGYDPSRSYPVLFYLHGNGSRGSDNLTHIRNSSAEVLRLIENDAALRENIIVIAPQNDKRLNWVEPDALAERVMEPEMTPYLSSALEILDYWLSHSAADPARVCLWGNSMGAYAVYDLMSRFPRRFSGGVAVAGLGDLAQAETLCRERLWIFHGTEDKLVLFDGDDKLVRAMRASGAGDNIRFTVYEGRGHDIFPDVGRDHAVLGWLFFGA